MSKIDKPVTREELQQAVEDIKNNTDVNEVHEQLKPVVQKILELIANLHLPVGNTSKEDEEKLYQASEQVLKLILDSNIKYMEKDILFQLVLQPLDTIKNIVLASLNRSANKVVARKFGKEFQEVTLQEMDEILKQPEPSELSTLQVSKDKVN